MTLKFLRYTTVLFGVGLVSIQAQAFEVPSLTGPVVDEAHIINGESAGLLDQALRELHDRGGTQLVVLTVPTIDDLTIEQASIKVADAWKLGSKKGDEGVLLMIAAKERRMRIEVGQGLEGQLTDIATKRIIEDAMVPLFKAGRVSDGIVLGVYQISRLTNPDIDLANILEGGERGGESSRGYQPNKIQGLIFLIAFFLIIGFKILSMFLWFPGGSARSYRGRRAGWGGGFGGGGFGGGGGGFGGGGGGFSGGGSSGSW